MRELVFVLEQTLGHVAHGMNLERVAGADPDIDATFLRLDFEERQGWERLPGLGSWSTRASLAARRRLTRRLAERPVDAIFIHTQVSALLATGIMRRIPTIVSLDATPLNFDRVGVAYSHRVSSPTIEGIKRAINQRAFSAAAGLVTWCRWAADSLREDYGVPAEKIRIIPPGVDTSVFSPAPRESTGPVRLLFVGGDLERKGGHDLLQALEGLGGQVELDIVTGAQVDVSGRGVPIRVHSGLRPQSPDLVRLFREADVFVLPARGDCLPQAIAEAMACGLPVVATPVGAIPEMVSDGKTGLLVPPGAPGRLAQALAALVADPRRRAAMGAAGLEVARRDHDMARNNRSILALMTDLTQARQFAMSVT
jgi:glycosyltransferase involved in cell wall biosynthesis